MANNNDPARYNLLDIDRRITQEINKAADELSELRKLGDYSSANVNYHRLNHIHDLFDEASEIIRDLKIENSSENLLEILEAKKHIRESFGSFQYIQNEINQLVKEADKDEAVLEIRDQDNNVIIDNSASVQEHDVIDKDDEFEFFEKFDELELKSKEKNEKKLKAKKERERQTKLRQEREAREEAYRNYSTGKTGSDYYKKDDYTQGQDTYRFITDYEDNEKYSQQQRQEEAYRLGMRVSDAKPVTATELQNEQYRQYEEEVEKRQKAEDLRKREQEAFDKYRQREEELSNYESFGKEHIDFSSEYHKERAQQRETTESSFVDSKFSSYSDYTGDNSYNSYKYYSYAPAGKDGGDYSVYENNYDKYTDSSGKKDVDYSEYKSSFGRYDDNIAVDRNTFVNNTDIYKAIGNQVQTAKEDGTPIVVSAVYTDMLKRNVDAAREQWRRVRGTPEESHAIQNYKEQRKVLDNVRHDINNNVYIIEGEKYTPVNHIPYERKEIPPQNSFFSRYVPGGTVSEPSSLQSATGRYIHNSQDRPRENFFYTADNPMVVSKEYRDAIYKRAYESKETFNQLVDYGRNSKNGPLRISEKSASEIAFAVDAYKGFRNAEKAGVVVVSETSGYKTADFDLWQQRKDIKYEAGFNRNYNQLKLDTNNIPSNITRPFKYTPENPIVVSKEYRDDIFKKGKEVEKSYSVIGSDVKGKKVDPKIKLYDDAYKGFRRAEKAGVIVVSEDSSLKKPDFELWQQFKRLDEQSDKKEKIDYKINELGTGTQGGFKFFNRSKAGLEDSPHFSQKKIYDAHFKRLYGHTEHYAKRAGRMFTRRAYSMLQSGDDNALRTFEQGRYYVTTGIVFTNAVAHIRVINPDKAARLASSSKISLENKLKDNIKLQKYQTTNEFRAKIYKELDEDKTFFVTRKQIGRKVDELTLIHREKIEKKFGALANISDANLVSEIDKYKLMGTNLKAKIKELESLGAKLTPAQRKNLLELKKLHEANSLKLRKLFGLQKERNAMDIKLGVLRSGANQISKNVRALSSGLYALRGYISKPFREGDVLSANGLYNAATFIANRHTRKILMKSIKTSVWLSGRTIDAAYILTGNDPRLWRNAVDVVKLNTKVKVNTVKKTIKNMTSETGRKTIKTARQGAKILGNTISDYTPSKIRTAVKNGWQGLVSTKRKIDTITGSIRERYQRSLVNKGLSTIRTWVDRASKSIRLFFSTASKILTKALLAFGGVFALLVILVSVMGIFMSGSSAAGTILSPYESEDKINLAPYMKILNQEQSDFDTTLNETLSSKTYRGKTYDNITVNYATSTRSNHKEMLSMMAVRFKQDISLEDNPDVAVYLKGLYHDSHTLAAKESEPYSCSGCKTRTIHHNPGCEEYIDHCSGVLELRKCINKKEDGTCGGHKKYTCPGHKEKYCPGEHVDLTLTVSVLGFDEIFTADSIGNAGANVQEGGLIGHATITYYCAEKYPHICNAGPPYLTASGTTPKPNRTIAVDPKLIPLGKHVVIFGQEYVAEDTGGAVDGMHIDILVETHKEALAKGTRYNVPVYGVSIDGEGGEDAEEWEGWTKDNIEWAKLIYSPNWGEIYEGINDYGDGNIEIGDLVVAGDWIWPVTSTTASSGFGWRDDPMNPGNPDFHKGTDIAIPEGTPVHAAGDGTVAAANFSSSAGNMIIINHADGVVTKYYHNSRLLVSVGDKVKAGQVIAYSGNTGNSTGPHLHFEFWVNGKVMDPRLQYGL